MNCINWLFFQKFLSSPCKLDFDRWSGLPLPLVGCISLVKMFVLPKFLYLFSHTPVLIRKSFFRSLDHLISSFLWGNKNPRIRKSVLQLLKALGGLALPSFLLYYWSCNSHDLLYWINNTTGEEHPAWVAIELASSKLSLHSLVCSTLQLTAPNFSSNSVVTNTIKICIQIRKGLGLHRAWELSPMVNNHLFIPSPTDSTFGLGLTKE